MAKELVVVLDFGGQYNQLIARRIRDLGVYAEVHPSSMGLDQLKALNPKGIIFTGGPQSVYKEESQHIDPAIFSMGIPILGICYGAQLIAYELGGVVKTAPVSEYGHTKVLVDRQDSVLQGISEETTMWMSHTDYIAEVPEGFHIIAHTADCPVAGMEDPARQIYAVQFHPEVQHSVEGHKLFHNFLYNVCKCAGDWKMETFVQDKIAEIRETVKDGKVLLALSGGVDSSVAATLMAKAIGMNVVAFARHPNAAVSEKLGIPYVSMDELLATSDFISLHAPAVDGGALVNEASIAKMKDGVVIINTSRGANVDEAALLAALESGKVRAAGLDVYADEPATNKALYSHPMVSCTPHIGAATVEAQKRIGAEIVDIISKM